jgi:hypothetical protein
VCRRAGQYVKIRTFSLNATIQCLCRPPAATTIASNVALARPSTRLNLWVAAEAVRRRFARVSNCGAPLPSIDRDVLDHGHNGFCIVTWIGTITDRCSIPYNSLILLTYTRGNKPQERAKRRKVIIETRLRPA